MFKFFSRKKTLPAPAAPVSYHADYPEAVTLAARHAEEHRAPTRWLEDQSIAPPTQEELDAMEPVEDMTARHEAELLAAIGSLSDLGALRFRGVYSQERANHSMASAERMKACMGPERVQQMEQRQEDAKQLLTEYLEGKPQSPEIMDAIERGLRDGSRVAEANGADRDAVSKEIGRELAAWRMSNVEPSAIAMEVHSLAMSKGMDEVHAKRTHSLPSTPPPPLPVPLASRLPFLEKAPFYTSRMEKVTFIAGRLGQGTGHLLADGKILIPGGEFMFSINHVKAVELATQERVSKWSSALGWGLVGGSLLGPAGAIVGGLLGGQKDQMTYLVTFSEEHRILISSSPNLYHKLLGATL